MFEIPLFRHIYDQSKSTNSGLEMHCYTNVV